MKRSSVEGELSSFTVKRLVSVLIHGVLLENIVEHSSLNIVNVGMCKTV